MHLILFRLGCIQFFNIIAKLARLSQPRGTEMRRQPYIIRAGDGCEVKYYKREVLITLVLITLVLILNIMPLTIIYAVACIYSKWLKIQYFISWPKLNRYIRGTYSFNNIYIFRGGAVVQPFKISILFTVYISLLVLNTFFIIGWQYLSISRTIYPHSTT